MKLFIYDDQGEFAAVNTNEFDSNEEAAISLVNELIDWSDSEDASECYSASECKAHVLECDRLKSNIRAQAIDFEIADFYETELGFIFSCQD